MSVNRYKSALLTQTSLELWQRMLSVNLTGTFLCAKEALPDMLQSHYGRIVNIASTAGQRGYAYVSAYAAAKHGVIGLMKVLAQEAGPHRIRVNAVCPTTVRTPLVMLRGIGR